MEPVRIVDLDSGREASGTTLEKSEQGLSLRCAEGFAPGSLLKLEVAEALLLGEVCYQRQREDGSYVMGIKVAHTLRGLAVYRNLREGMQQPEATVEPVA